MQLKDNGSCFALETSLDNISNIDNIFTEKSPFIKAYVSSNKEVYGGLK
jgi:hypothetical protein